MNLNEDAIQGLLYTGLGILSNNTGHYGRFGPAIGKGGLLGLQAMEKAKQDREEAAFKERQITMLESFKKAQEDKLRAEEDERRRERIFYGIDKPAPTPMMPQPMFGEAKPQFPTDFGAVTAPPPIARPMQTAASMPAPVPLAPPGNEMTAPEEEVKATTNELTLAHKMVEGFRSQMKKLEALQKLAPTIRARNQIQQEYETAAGLYKNATDNYTRILGFRKTPHFEDVPVSNKDPNNPMVLKHRWNTDTERLEVVPNAVESPKFTKNPLLYVDMVGKGTQKYVEEFSSGIVKKDLQLQESAANAPRLAARANDILKIVNSGKVITGAGADYRLMFAKVMGLGGLSDQETIANTESLFRDMAEATLSQIKTSGLGAGQGFTNTDREFLEKAVGGKLSYDERTIRRIAVLTHKAAVESAKKWEERSIEIPEEALKATGLKRGHKIELPPLDDPGQTTSKGDSEEMPDPTTNKGKILTDTKTGKKYQSDGMQWKEAQ